MREFVTASLSAVAGDQLKSPYWAIHPAGLALLMRISRKVGLANEALKASAEHYSRFSNMSSAGVLHVLRDLAESAETGAGLNICTMGAGFNVIYGRVKKLGNP